MWNIELIVKHYRGKVEQVYLYCNKPLKSESLYETNKILDDAGIKLELITDNAILDLVRDYPALGFYYFDTQSLILY